MSRVSPLHTTYALIWLGWTAALIGYLWWLPRVVFVDVAFIAGFLVVEGLAVRTSKQVEWRGSMVAARDTLSQVMTWFARMAKPGTRWYQSWCGATVVIALHVSWLVARQPPEPWIQKATGLLMMGFLVWHWLRPEKVG